jgi:hypothetical protein
LGPSALPQLQSKLRLQPIDLQRFFNDYQQKSDSKVLVGSAQRAHKSHEFLTKKVQNLRVLLATPKASPNKHNWLFHASKH